MVTAHENQDRANNCEPRSEVVDLEELFAQISRDSLERQKPVRHGNRGTGEWEVNPEREAPYMAADRREVIR